MRVPLPNPIQHHPLQKSESIPVPIETESQEKRDLSWIYGVMAVLIILLLLFLLLFSFAKEINPAGNASGGDAGVPNAPTESNAPLESNDHPLPDVGKENISSNEKQEAKDEPAESEGSTESTSLSAAESDTNSSTKTPETETPKNTSIEQLVLQLNADRSESADSQTEAAQQEKESDGNAIRKGDASVSFFGATGKGSQFVFVFDRSQSMAGKPLESVKRELINALEPLKENHFFNIITYDHEYALWKNKLVAATKDNKADAVSVIEGTTIRGGTEPRIPLLIAIDQKPEVIFFMTDGEFDMDVNEIAAKSKKIVINVVQFSRFDQPLPVLQSIAHRTGGDFMLINIGKLSNSL